MEQLSYDACFKSHVKNMIKTLDSRGSSLGAEERAAVNYYSRHMEMFKTLHGARGKCIRWVTPTAQPCGGLDGPSFQGQEHHVDPGNGHHSGKAKFTFCQTHYVFRTCGLGIMLPCYRRESSRSGRRSDLSDMLRRVQVRPAPPPESGPRLLPRPAVTPHT